jgi:hypothetical protein
MDGGPDWGREHVERQAAVERECHMSEIQFLRRVVAEARQIIGHVGWTSCEQPSVIKAAEKWMKDYEHA